MPKSQPVLRARRLALRPYRLGDVTSLVCLAGQREIAHTTVSIPHPYSRQDAQNWIKRAAKGWKEGKLAGFAIVRQKDRQLVGSIGLMGIDPEHGQAEMGFWIGVEFWGKGYATEAAAALLKFGFGVLGLNRIYAHHMLRNPASGRVMEKLGMTKEGVLRERVRKWGKFEDVALFAVLKRDWQGTRR